MPVPAIYFVRKAFILEETSGTSEDGAQWSQGGSQQQLSLGAYLLHDAPN